MNARRNRIVVGLALVAVVIAAASVYSLFTAYYSEIDSHRRVLLGRGETALDALKAGILAHGRMGRYRGERLAVILEELARNPGILALELRDPGGRAVATGGPLEKIPADAPTQPHWTDNRLIMAGPINFGAEHERRMGEGGWRGGEDMQGWESFANGAYVLTVVLDASEFHRAVRRHQIQLAVSLGVISAALVTGTLAAYLLLRRTELGLLLERERERAQRQEQVARLGAGLAHETKNPLGIVRGLAQSIGDCSLSGCPIRDRARHIVDEVDRVIGGIDSFLSLARPQEATPAPAILDVFFAKLLPLVQMDAAAAGVSVTYAPCGLSVFADERLLRRALLNLILNALRASRPGQAVQIDTVRADGILTLRVTDTGCGIAPEDLPQVVEPYFTRFEGGTGLGLSEVNQIAAAHGWRLGISSVLGQGTRAVLEGISIVESS